MSTNPQSLSMLLTTKRGRSSSKRMSQSIVPVKARAQQHNMSVLGTMPSLFKDDLSFHQAFNDGVENARRESTQLEPQSRLMIDQMLDDFKTFLIKGRKHEYQGEQDPIFSLSKPVPHRTKASSGACMCCSQAFKNLKAVAYCEFCGWHVCRACLVKQRPFPMQGDNVKEVVKQRGTICMVCDRKHYIKDSLQATLDTIEANQTIIENLQGQVKLKEEGAKQLELEFEHFKYLFDSDSRRAKTMIEETRRKKDLLQQEAMSINEDYRHQYEKKMAMQQEMIEIEETVNDVTEDLSQIDQEMLRIRIKMRQADIERERMEQELTALRRQLGSKGRGKNAQQRQGNPVSAMQDDSKKKSEQDMNGEDMFFNLASVDESEDGFIAGSNTHIPRDTNMYRSTLGLDEEEGMLNMLGLSSRMSTRSGRRSKSIKNKYRRDNQTYCGTAPGQKCSIF
ncbi:hypothetical protein FGO68_gene4939 [Halteria grandinella]|uniref:FYVE-type domain-containing protein n=1 Tax=Halteria grandinella TaxID=5974 RepID=A0A8J8T8V8_HALGN|nr:hypothetical protein FGO68_gene4939 [Halteria grandinella]